MEGLVLNGVGSKWSWFSDNVWLADWAAKLHYNYSKLGII